MSAKNLIAAAALASLALAGCRNNATGPIAVSAIGAQPRLGNPNLAPLDTPSATLTEAVAQGLVRFDSAGQIEPALAQSWIVSDDGLRYTFRIARTSWANGAPVTAEQIEARLKATLSRGSRNPLKPLLAVVADVQAMTERVIEISLRAPRPNLLQLLAQPEMGIVRNGAGTGPYQAEPRADGALALTLREEDEAEEREESPDSEIILRGEGAALAVARFDRRLADLVVGGTAGDLPIVRAAALPGGALRFDPAAGMLGLAFLRTDGELGNPEVRRALSMAIDRSALVASIGVTNLLPRESLVSPGVEEYPIPALPAWTAAPLAVRRGTASAIVADLEEGAPALRVAVPDAPGYRLLFAHLRRDWRLIGVDAEAVPTTADADLALVDAVAAANLATWYLRRFACASSAVCSPEADIMLDNARNARSASERRAFLAEADRLLTEATPFIPLTAPVRWSLVSPRLTGYQPNPFARHFVGGLLAARR